MSKGINVMVWQNVPKTAGTSLLPPKIKRFERNIIFEDNHCTYPVVTDECVGVMVR